MNVGAEPKVSTRGLLATVAWTLDTGAARATAYALEGSAFIAGALVQWLRDGLGLIEQAAEIEALARSVPDSGGVTIVPGADRAWARRTGAPTRAASSPA